MRKINKLTDEQKQLVEENHKLIYFVLKKLGVPEDEYYGTAAEALCNAAALFKPNKGMKFSTYACRSIENMCFVQMQLKKRECEVPPDKVTYLDATWTANDGDEFKQNISVQSSENIEHDAIFRTIYVDTLEKLPEHHQGMIDMLMRGYRLRDVGEKYGISKERVRQIFAVFTGMMRNEFKHT